MLQHKKNFVRCLFLGNHIALAVFVLSLVIAVLVWIILWPYHWTFGCFGIGLSAYMMFSAYDLNTETLETYLAVTEFLEKPGLSQDEAVKRTLQGSRRFGYCGIRGMKLAFRDKGIDVP